METKKKIQVLINKGELEQLKSGYNTLLGETAKMMVALYNITNTKSMSNFEKLKNVEEQLHLFTFRTKCRIED